MCSAYVCMIILCNGVYKMQSQFVCRETQARQGQLFREGKFSLGMGDPRASHPL